jgi:hypothetical protein
MGRYSSIALAYPDGRTVRADKVIEVMKKSKKVMDATGVRDSSCKEVAASFLKDGYTFPSGEQLFIDACEEAMHGVPLPQ